MVNLIDSLKNKSMLSTSFFSELQAISQVHKKVTSGYFDFQKIHQGTIDAVRKSLEPSIKTLAIIESFNKKLEDVHRTIKGIYPLNIDISNLAYSEYDLSIAIEEDKEENIVINETARIKEIIKSIYRENKNLLSLHSRDFEEVIAELLEFQGFKVELTKQTRDDGYDIIAIKYLEGHIPVKFLVECKKYTKQKVGVEIIRGFKEVINTEKANRGVIVTTSYFTKDAVKKQKEIPYLLDFRDKDDVINWVNDYWKGL